MPSLTESPPPAQPPDPQLPGGASGWLSAVRGLTVTNALVVMMLAVVAIPGYFVYRALDDPALLDRFLSSYRVVPSHSSCILRQGRQRGEPYQWGLSAGFAFEDSKRWIVSVQMDAEPDAEELKSYCATLQIIVDFLHGGGGPLPDVVWQYKDVEGKEGEKGLDGER